MQCHPAVHLQGNFEKKIAICPDCHRCYCSAILLCSLRSCMRQANGNITDQQHNLIWNRKSAPSEGSVFLRMKADAMMTVFRLYFYLVCYTDVTRYHYQLSWPFWWNYLTRPSRRTKASCRNEKCLILAREKIGQNYINKKWCIPARDSFFMHPTPSLIPTLRIFVKTQH